MSYSLDPEDRMQRDEIMITNRNLPTMKMTGGRDTKQTFTGQTSDTGDSPPRH